MIINPSIPIKIQDKPKEIIKHLLEEKKLRENNNFLMYQIINLYERVVQKDYPTFDEWFNLQWEAISKMDLFVSSYSEHGSLNYYKE